MTLTKEQMIERGQQWREESKAEHQGHRCPQWKGAWIDSRDTNEFEACKCVHQLESEHEPS